MAALPTGTLTFLLTDVEGSTRLWDQHPEAMRPALARHDQIIEDSVGHYSGTLVRPRGEGDSCFAVFRSAASASLAAVTIQRALHTEAWPMAAGMRVHMALHTGEADLRDGDYYGGVPNRCARLRTLAHGGQILLSATTAGLIRDELPADLSLRDLGTHRLKDLSSPERIFQLVSVDLPSEFPPLRSLDVLPTNLPVQVTSFVGREPELAEVKRLLGATRLLTLMGTGGSGKTRLALQASADLLDQYADGVWLVDFASLAQPELVPQAIASVVGVREEPGHAVLETLSSALRSRQSLLVLDNCEHLVTTIGQLVDALIHACPRVHILSTSREALSIAGETTWRVPPLRMADPNHLPKLEALTQYEAVRLFIDRALAGQPHFAVTNRNAPAVAQICHRLDGIPLAIELAAARVTVLTPEQIAERLDQRFQLLTGGSRTAIPRQQTLRALVDWSFDLLSDQERALFRRLAVFAGGWTLEAAEAACVAPPIGRGEVLDVLSALVDKSLVLADEQPGGQMRYRLLETLREYGAERVAEAGERYALFHEHAEYFLSGVERIDELRKTDWQRWRSEGWPWLLGEQDNIRSVLSRCRVGTVDPGGESELGLRVCNGMWWSWFQQDRLVESWDWHRALLAVGPGRVSPSRFFATWYAGISATGMANFQESEALLTRARGLADELGDDQARALAESATLCRRKGRRRSAGRAPRRGRAHAARLRRLCARHASRQRKSPSATRQGDAADGAEDARGDEVRLRDLGNRKARGRTRRRRRRRLRPDVAPGRQDGQADARHRMVAAVCVFFAAGDDRAAGRVALGVPESGRRPQGADRQRGDGRHQRPGHHSRA